MASSRSYVSTEQPLRAAIRFVVPHSIPECGQDDGIALGHENRSQTKLVAHLRCYRCCQEQYNYFRKYENIVIVFFYHF